MRQAIIWTNADPVHWRIYAALGGEEVIALRSGQNGCHHDLTDIQTVPADQDFRYQITSQYYQYYEEKFSCKGTPVINPS